MSESHKCPTCQSTAPDMHPAVQHCGEVHICADAFHLTPTPQNRPEYIEAVKMRRATDKMFRTAMGAFPYYKD